jgi:hypothetical protein
VSVSALSRQRPDLPCETEVYAAPLSEDVIASHLKAPEPKSLIGIVPNALHQKGESVFAFEFDDQGLCHERGQMLRIAENLDALAAADEDAILVIYVHGSKHDARSDDSDLRVFASILDQLAYYEIKQAEQQSPPQTPRRVLGVFAAWRGMSDWLHWLENITYWTRQAAALRVSAGSVRQLFGRARSCRRNRRTGGRAILAIVGHSFGGKIVYSALEQSLIEAASTPAGKVAPSFADLVLLINPAVGSINYLPIKVVVDERSDAQLPVIVCAPRGMTWRHATPFRSAIPFRSLLKTGKGRATKRRDGMRSATILRSRPATSLRRPATGSPITSFIPRPEKQENQQAVLDPSGVA